MIAFPLLAAVALAAEPSPAQRTLLETFRQEFVRLAPGEGAFPASVTVGRNDGPANERPAHLATLPRSFFMAKYEVPQNLWEAVMGANPSRWKGPRNSVEQLSWVEANAFCAKATELMRAAKLIESDWEIRLPSEAEWEYAARAGTETLYSFGADATALDEYAWHTGNAAGNDPPVGAKMPNPWGLYDMHGYLWEWCADAWHDTYRDAPPDGAPWNSDGDRTRRVLRGGSWKDAAAQLTSSSRRAAPADFRDDAVGLRCVLGQKAEP